ncbi:MAG: hypothetical protein AAF644_16370, partial [Pseudomonadota bacterium]
MKKLIALSAIAMLSSGAALAENINISGSVASVCEVSNLDTSTYFPSIAKEPLILMFSASAAPDDNIAIADNAISFFI